MKTKMSIFFLLCRCRQKQKNFRDFKLSFITKLTKKCKVKVFVIINTLYNTQLKIDSLVNWFRNESCGALSMKFMMSWHLMRITLGNNSLTALYIIRRLALINNRDWILYEKNLSLTNSFCFFLSEITFHMRMESMECRCYLMKEENKKHNKNIFKIFSFHIVSSERR
jgi:hypothetical protein